MRLFLIIAALLIAAPAAAQKAEDHLADCTPEKPANEYELSCEASQVDFRKWFKLAIRGDYQGQRNVAYYLGGRDKSGAVKPDMMAACAWRIVIISLGSKDVWSGDTSNVKIDCGKLDEVEQAAAKAKAIRILSKMKL